KANVFRSEPVALFAALSPHCAATVYMRRNSGGQKRHRGLMQALVAAGENGFSIAAIAAGPAGDHAARAFDQGNQGGDIPGLKSRFDDQIDKSQGQRREQITIAAKTGHPRGGGNPLKTGLLRVGEISAWIAGAE